MISTVTAIILGLSFSLAAVEKEPAPPMPPVAVRDKGAEWGPRKWTWEGVTIVLDPVNKETLYLCGRVGGAAFGTIGSWALAADGKTWRQMAVRSEMLDPLAMKCVFSGLAASTAEAAARNILLAALDAGKEAEAARGEPLKWIERAGAASLLAEMAAARATGREADAIAQAKPLVARALEAANAAQAGFAAGKLNAGLIAKCFDARWALDEGAACLTSAPGPRQDAAAAYDPVNQCVVLFGGSHGDYLMSDTWVYDCPTKQWRQVWPKAAPPPRAMASWAPRLTSGSLRWDEARKRLVLSGGVTLLDKMVYQQGFKALPEDEWEFDAKAGEWTAVKGGPAVAPATRLYRTILPAYDPRWYDAAPRPDPKATAEWLAALKPNTWTEVPKQDRPCPERDWGTARYDPDRDQICRWTGGHCADPSNIVSTYHPAANRWSIGYVAEIYGKGMSFSGRPDCLNHTYLHWDYDPVSRCLVCTSMGGTGVYDPDRMDWGFSAAQPFNHHIYETCTASTPKGVIVWTPGFFGVFDAAAKEWRKLPVEGKLPRSVTDGSALTYDSKRDCLWMATFAGYQKPNGQIWRYGLKSGAVQPMNPAGQQTIGMGKGFDKEIRECVCLPGLDLVLFNNFVADRQVAYDPAGNRWVLLGIARGFKQLGTVSIGLVYDTRRGLVWAMGAYKEIYVLRIDPKALAVSDDPAR